MPGSRPSFVAGERAALALRPGATGRAWVVGQVLVDDGRAVRMQTWSLFTGQGFPRHYGRPFAAQATEDVVLLIPHAQITGALVAEDDDDLDTFLLDAEQFVQDVLFQRPR